MSSIKFNEEDVQNMRLALHRQWNRKVKKLTAKELLVLSKVLPSEKKVEKVEKKKPIPFIIESDSEEESEEESDDEGEFTCSECGCDGMYTPDDTCSKCLIEMCRKR